MWMGRVGVVKGKIWEKVYFLFIMHGRRNEMREQTNTWFIDES